MNFYEYQTLFETYKRNFKDMEEEFRANPLRFYDWYISNTPRFMPIEQASIEVNRGIIERCWYENGKPYFKVYPNELELFTNVVIKDIPCKYLIPPFNSFLIRLAEPAALRIDESRNLFVKSMLVFDSKTQLEKSEWLSGRFEIVDKRSLSIWIDINESYDGGPSRDFIQLECDPESSVEDAAKVLPRRDSDINDQLHEKLLRLVCSVCFLATSEDKLLTKDILSKDLATYIEAQRTKNTERIKAIEDRAERKGKRGWNIGREIDRARQIVARTEHENADGIEKEHRKVSHRFVRRAHFRLAHSKAIFVRQHMVKPELPAK
jgi:hypothetical protein